MSLILNTKNNKEKCQKFTPSYLVDEMIKLIGYSHDIIGKKFLEISFGTGNILIHVVKLYVEESLKRGLQHHEIKKNIKNDIYGIELDTQLYENCILELNELLNSYGIQNVEWSLYNEDALKLDLDVKFDYIIGNPPYITYKNIDFDSREWIKNNYKTCKYGKFDYCYPFLEKCCNLLSVNGKMVQLVPSNIYKNVYAAELRTLLLPNITEVWEYPDCKHFGDAMTTSSIFLYENNKNTPTLYYRNITESNSFNVFKYELGAKWVFSKKIDNNNNNNIIIRFGDVFNASVTVATLYNTAFVLKGDPLDKKIELDVIREAASPRGLKSKKKEYIIFPYFYDENGNLHKYDEVEFCRKYPNAALHLKKFTKELESRASDTNAKWFEYGRSQAINNLNREKLLLSTVVTKEVQLYKLDKDCIPYSGIYITVKDDNYSLDDAINILTGKDFLNYVNGLGISVSGKSKRITCKDINNFMYSKEL